MISRFRQLVRDMLALRVLPSRQTSLLQAQDQLLIAQGAAHAALNRLRPIKNLNDAEFKIFSQFGEDGIIQFLTSTIDVANKTFIEFGVENFVESNCRFLMVNNNWRGSGAELEI